MYQVYKFIIFARRLFKRFEKQFLFLFFAFLFILFVVVYVQVSSNYVSEIDENFNPLYSGGEIDFDFNILVTGGCGFIGSHIVEFFESVERCKRIIIVDNLVTGKLENINQENEKIMFIEGSIMDKELLDQIFTTYRIDYVYHLAALVSAAESVYDPESYFKVLTLGTMNVMERVKEDAHVKRFILASSAAIYGDDPRIPKYEDFIPCCKSPYAQAKYDGEFMLNMYNDLLKEEDKKFLGIAVRFFNVFGERQDPESQYSAVIPKFIENVCVRKNKITVFGDGEQTRDFVYVKDVVSAMVHLSFTDFFDHKFEEWKETNNIVFNVGYGNSISINELAKMVFEECPSINNFIEYKKERPGDVKHSKCSNLKLRNTGWKQKYAMNKAFQKTIRWFIANYQVDL